MPKKFKKTHVGFRLDERVVALLEKLAKDYKISMTDIIDMGVKRFLTTVYNSISEMDRTVGEHRRGEFDRDIESIFEVQFPVQNKPTRPSKKSS